MSGKLRDAQVDNLRRSTNNHRGRPDLLTHRPGRQTHPPFAMLVLLLLLLRPLTLLFVVYHDGGLNGFLS